MQLGYQPGLDGLRAVAVAAVLLYHGGVSWAAGGFLGVEAFFVLSGFLITSLLVAEWRSSSTIALRAFWARRARRLLPGLFCLVSVIGIYYALAGPDDTVPGLKGDGLSTLLYVGNWHQIADGSGYFAANGPVSPLHHTWSLAIEEQFYLLWPVLLLGALSLARRQRSLGARGSLAALLAVSVTGVLVSAVEMALLFDGGRGLDRVYYGTDTRAASLLLGASLAIALAIFADRGAPNRRARRLRVGGSVRGAAAVVGLMAALVMMHFAAGDSQWLYPFGLLGLDAAVAMVILAVVLSPSSAVARVLSLAPIRATGKISYGIYLWHFPLFLWMDETSTGVSGTRLLLLRLTVTLLVSVASFFVIEQPVRRRRPPTWLLRTLAPLAAAGAVATLMLASTVESTALGLAAIPPPAKTTAQLQGTDPACRVLLRDTKDYGLSPLAPREAAREEPAWLVAHRLQWSGSSRLAFNTCPPKRVLLIGDSLAFTLGVGLMEGEQRYGVEVADAAILGCAFTTRGELNSRGTWEGQYPGCPSALMRWALDERALRAQAVIVELGYRDEFDWRIRGRVVHLGQAAFDRYVQGQIDRYVQVLGRRGVPILFLSVPWSDPAALPDGSPAPAAAPARHTAINSMLQSAAARYPGEVRVLDIDKVVAPGNHYERTVDGKLCRFDGVHFTIFCSNLLQFDVLTAARTMLADVTSSRGA